MLSLAGQILPAHRQNAMQLFAGQAKIFRAVPMFKPFQVQNHDNASCHADARRISFEHAEITCWLGLCTVWLSGQTSATLFRQHLLLSHADI